MIQFQGAAARRWREFRIRLSDRRLARKAPITATMVAAMGTGPEERGEATDIRHKILYAFEVASVHPTPSAACAAQFPDRGSGAYRGRTGGAIGEIAGQTLRNDFRSIRPADAQIALC
jgi:hypothetical protein